MVPFIRIVVLRSDWDLQVGYQHITAVLQSSSLSAELNVSLNNVTTLTIAPKEDAHRCEH